MTEFLENEWVSIPEAAKLTRISARTFYTWHQVNRFPGLFGKRGQGVRVKVSELQRLLDSHRTEKIESGL